MYKNQLLFPIIISLIITGCSNAPSHIIGSQNRVVPFEEQLPDNHLLMVQFNKWSGTPYRLGGNSLNGVDCSAFVQEVYRSALGLALPRTTALQSERGRSIEYQQVKTGDLVFFKTSYKTRHVGIYLDNNRFMHASTSKGVIISRLDNPYWASAFWQIRRVNES
ncbi:NlpC/P60 family protein [Vibrio clamense]|uniref:C40 family peptidase n=1 Tax=Vibrio clamense TaxID=2910254 RepID=UPI003D1A7725